MPLNKEYGDVEASQIFTGGPNQTAIAETFVNALVEGKPLADDGSLYSTVQDAENAASGWVFVPPGTFNETVTIDTAGLTLVGAGHGTLISGASGGNGIEPAASDVTIKDLRVETTLTGNSERAIQTQTGADRITIERVEIIEAEGSDLNIAHGGDHLITNVRITQSSGAGVYVSAPRTTIAYCHFSTGHNGVRLDADDGIIFGCVFNGCSSNGIQASANDTLTGANRVHNSGSSGINLDNTDQIAFNNRISDSTDADMDTQHATNPTTDANLTGSAN